MKSQWVSQCRLWHMDTVKHYGAYHHVFFASELKLVFRNMQKSIRTKFFVTLMKPNHQISKGSMRCGCGMTVAPKPLGSLQEVHFQCPVHLYIIVTTWLAYSAFSVNHILLHSARDKPIWSDLRSLYTWSKSRDHEIVRAQKECPKAVPIHFQNHVMWSRDLVVQCEAMCDRFSTKCYFNKSLFVRDSPTQ